MKKSVVVILTFLILSSLVLAANETIQERASSCLDSKINDKCSTLTLEQQAFSVMSGNTECKSSLKDLGKDNECWPTSSCKIKDTSLAILALKQTGDNTDKAEEWILSKKKSPSNIEFYLEIEIPTASLSECTLSYDSVSKRITIAEDRTISGEPGSCFSLAYDNYWLKVRESCLTKNFTVSCNKDFISTILYKKTNSNVWHVSSDVQSASQSGQTSHEINAYCFSASSACNYEENLWAALAMKDESLSPLLPYLISLADDNKELFPSTFLYLFTNSEEYLSDMLALQKSDSSWDLKNKGKFYDTALAILALPDSEAENNAKSWLGEIQGADGCWNNGNIRDTGMLLWAGWPESSGGGGGSDIARCTDYSYYCISQGECDEAGGNKLGNFYCSSPQICCDTPKKQKTCDEQGGEICTSEETCDESEISASDTESCCMGSCIPIKSECELAGNSCNSVCTDNEQENSVLDCNTGICCEPKSSSLWIWILIILIILAILGIIFRNKLRLFIFKLRGGVSSQTVTKTRPPFPPATPQIRQGMRPQIMQRPVLRQQSRAKPDTELEDTLKKLREMSK
ncbi:hypothetical protein HYW76_03200 [Candidatus Pacearchaeota archaeon]|nr:hypothetical protein [Candidatus Pacearchaeota archaeon]